MKKSGKEYMANVPSAKCITYSDGRRKRNDKAQKKTPKQTK